MISLKREPSINLIHPGQKAAYWFSSHFSLDSTLSSVTVPSTLDGKNPAEVSSRHPQKRPPRSHFHFHTMSFESSELLTIGWREWVALPELGVTSIKAKVDSGARTSCLHTAEYEIFQKDGSDWVRFIVHPIKRHTEVEIRTEVPVSDYRIVRDSGGHEERRPFIKTTLKIGSHLWPIEVSLSNRENMKFRMLLGRTGITGRALIDCSKSYLTKSKTRRNES